MSNLRRLFLTSVCAFALSNTVACNRLPLPNEPQPSAAPSDAPAPPAPGPGTPAPAPTQAPPAPNQPPAQPPAPNQPPAQPPAPDQPPAQPPVQPPAGNPALEKFWAQLGQAGFADQAVVAAELQKTAALKITGWSKGKAETPDQNVEAMFKITQGLFAKPPADPAEYAARSMAFATQPLDGCILLIDLKASAEHKNLFVLKHDPTSKQIVGINEKDLDYAPSISAMSAVRRLDGAPEGKIFFYGEENGKFLDPARFVPVPGDLLKPASVEAMRVRAASMYRTNTYYRR